MAPDKRKLSPKLCVGIIVSATGHSLSFKSFTMRDRRSPEKIRQDNIERFGQGGYQQTSSPHEQGRQRQSSGRTSDADVNEQDNEARVGRSDRRTVTEQP